MTGVFLEEEEQITSSVLNGTLRGQAVAVFYRPGPGDWSCRRERERREKEQYPLGYVENQSSPYTGLVPLTKAQSILSRRS